MNHEQILAKAFVHKIRAPGLTCTGGDDCDGKCRVRENLIKASKDYVEARDSYATTNAYQRMVALVKELYPDSSEAGR